MISVIIERSMMQTQMVWVYTSKSGEIWKLANVLEKEWVVSDVDVMEFENLTELNRRLQSQLKIPDKNIDWMK